MKTNVATPLATTHEGAPATKLRDPLAQLRRSLLSCMLFESEFYEDGQSIADRIIQSASECSPAALADLAVEARGKYKLRHAPLLILSVLAEIGSGHNRVSETIGQTIQRPDEIAEFLAIHAARHGITPDKLKTCISAQIKKGLAKAFNNFDEYQFAKYDRDAPIKLRDALFLCHPKPKNKEQAGIFERIAQRELKTPDTWETNLSTGADKKESFERLLREGKIGYMALLRNLRNMQAAGVDSSLVSRAIRDRKGAERVLPFRFIAAARHAPGYANDLNQALLEQLETAGSLRGSTVVLVDVSASMTQRLSGKSDMLRMDAAAALGVLVQSDHKRVLTFSNKLAEVPNYDGLPGVNAIIGSQIHSGTQLGNAIAVINDQIRSDRIIVVTDEQSHDRVPDPVAKHAYIINVGSYENGVGYRRWTHIDGFSEKVLDFIREVEA